MMKIVLALPMLAAAAPSFNWTKCPAVHEIQAARVATDLTMDNYQGFYYELAFHDIFQAICPSVQCVYSNKSLHTWSDGQKYISEEWGLGCMGHAYPQTLLNNLTEQPGYFLSFVPQAKPPFSIINKWTKNLLFPNTVVDFKSGPKGYTLEFQCVEAAGKIRYIGINFYARDTSEETFQEMLAAAKASGMDFYMNKGNPGFNFRRVDHSNCPHEPKPPQALLMV